MEIKSLIHPQEIRKHGLMYRSWHLLLVNRIWHVERVPEKSHICLWFWPALFATVLFRPVLYPMMLVLYSIVKYLIVLPGTFFIRLAAMGLQKGGRRTSEFLDTPVSSRLTIGSTLLLALAIALCVTPGVNRWFTGIVAVVVASYVVAKTLVRSIAAFFGTLGSLGSAISRQWHAALMSGAGAYRLAFAGSAVGALFSAAFIWFPTIALRTLLTLIAVVVLMAVIILVLEGISRLHKRVEARRWRRYAPDGGMTVEARRGSKKDVPARQRGGRSGTRLYLAAIVESACPEVQFVE